MNSNRIQGKALSLETTETVVYKPIYGNSSDQTFNSTENMMQTARSSSAPPAPPNLVRRVKIDHSNAMFVPKQIDKPVVSAPPKRIVTEPRKAPTIAGGVPQLQQKSKPPPTLAQRNAAERAKRLALLEASKAFDQHMRDAKKSKLNSKHAHEKLLISQLRMDIPQATASAAAAATSSSSSSSGGTVVATDVGGGVEGATVPYTGPEDGLQHPPVLQPQQQQQQHPPLLTVFIPTADGHHHQQQQHYDHYAASEGAYLAGAGGVGTGSRGHGSYARSSSKPAPAGSSGSGVGVGAGVRGVKSAPSHHVAAPVVFPMNSPGVNIVPRKGGLSDAQDDHVSRGPTVHISSSGASSGTSSSGSGGARHSSAVYADVKTSMANTLVYRFNANHVTSIAPGGVSHITTNMGTTTPDMAPDMAANAPEKAAPSTMSAVKDNDKDDGGYSDDDDFSVGGGGGRGELNTSTGSSIGGAKPGHSHNNNDVKLVDTIADSLLDKRLRVGRAYIAEQARKLAEEKKKEKMAVRSAAQKRKEALERVAQVAKAAAREPPVASSSGHHRGRRGVGLGAGGSEDGGGSVYSRGTVNTAHTVNTVTTNRSGGSTSTLAVDVADGDAGDSSAVGNPEAVRPNKNQEQQLEDFLDEEPSAFATTTDMDISVLSANSAACVDTAPVEGGRGGDEGSVVSMGSSSLRRAGVVAETAETAAGSSSSSVSSGRRYSTAVEDDDEVAMRESVDVDFGVDVDGDVDVAREDGDSDITKALNAEEEEEERNDSRFNDNHNHQHQQFSTSLEDEAIAAMFSLANPGLSKPRSVGAGAGGRAGIGGGLEFPLLTSIADTPLPPTTAAAAPSSRANNNGYTAHSSSSSSVSVSSNNSRTNSGNNNNNGRSSVLASHQRMQPPVRAQTHVPTTRRAQTQTQPVSGRGGSSSRSSSSGGGTSGIRAKSAPLIRPVPSTSGSATISTSRTSAGRMTPSTSVAAPVHRSAATATKRPTVGFGSSAGTGTGNASRRSLTPTPVATSRPRGTTAMTTTTASAAVTTVRKPRESAASKLPRATVTAGTRTRAGGNAARDAPKGSRGVLSRNTHVGGSRGSRANTAATITAARKSADVLSMLAPEPSEQSMLQDHHQQSSLSDIGTSMNITRISSDTVGRSSVDASGTVVGGAAGAGAVGTGDGRGTLKKSTEHPVLTSQLADIQAKLNSLPTSGYESKAEISSALEQVRQWGEQMILGMNKEIQVRLEYAEFMERQQRQVELHSHAAVASATPHHFHEGVVVDNNSNSASGQDRFVNLAVNSDAEEEGEDDEEEEVPPPAPLSDGSDNDREDGDESDTDSSDDHDSDGLGLLSLEQHDYGTSDEWMQRVIANSNAAAAGSGASGVTVGSVPGGNLITVSKTAVEAQAPTSTRYAAVANDHRDDFNIAEKDVELQRRLQSTLRDSMESLRASNNSRNSTQSRSSADNNVSNSIDSAGVAADYLAHLRQLETQLSDDNSSSSSGNNPATYRERYERLKADKKVNYSVDSTAADAALEADAAEPLDLRNVGELAGTLSYKYINMTGGGDTAAGTDIDIDVSDSVSSDSSAWSQASSSAPLSEAEDDDGDSYRGKRRSGSGGSTNLVNMYARNILKQKQDDVAAQAQVRLLSGSIINNANNNEDSDATAVTDDDGGDAVRLKERLAKLTAMALKANIRSREPASSDSSSVNDAEVSTGTATATATGASNKTFWDTLLERPLHDPAFQQPPDADDADADAEDSFVRGPTEPVVAGPIPSMPSAGTDDSVPRVVLSSRTNSASPSTNANTNTATANSSGGAAVTRMTPEELRYMLETELRRQDELLQYTCELNELETNYTIQNTQHYVQSITEQHRTEAIERQRLHELALQQQAYESSLGIAMASAEITRAQEQQRLHQDINDVQSQLLRQSLQHDIAMQRQETERVIETMANTAEMMELQQAWQAQQQQQAVQSMQQVQQQSTVPAIGVTSSVASTPKSVPAVAPIGSSSSRGTVVGVGGMKKPHATPTAVTKLQRPASAGRSRNKSDASTNGKSNFVDSNSRSINRQGRLNNSVSIADSNIYSDDDDDIDIVEEVEEENSYLFDQSIVSSASVVGATDASSSIIMSSMKGSRAAAAAAAAGSKKQQKQQLGTSSILEESILDVLDRDQQQHSDGSVEIEEEDGAGAGAAGSNSKKIGTRAHTTTTTVSESSSSNAYSTDEYSTNSFEEYTSSSADADNSSRVCVSTSASTKKVVVAMPSAAHSKGQVKLVPSKQQQQRDNSSYSVDEDISLDIVEEEKVDEDVLDEVEDDTAIEMTTATGIKSYRREKGSTTGESLSQSQSRATSRGFIADATSVAEDSSLLESSIVSEYAAQTAPLKPSVSVLGNAPLPPSSTSATAAAVSKASLRTASGVLLQKQLANQSDYSMDFDLEDGDSSRLDRRTSDLHSSIMSRNNSGYYDEDFEDDEKEEEEEEEDEEHKEKVAVPVPVVQKHALERGPIATATASAILMPPPQQAPSAVESASLSEQAQKLLITIDDILIQLKHEQVSELEQLKASALSNDSKTYTDHHKALTESKLKAVEAAQIYAHSTLSTYRDELAFRLYAEEKALTLRLQLVHAKHVKQTTLLQEQRGELENEKKRILSLLEQLGSAKRNNTAADAEEETQQTILSLKSQLAGTNALFSQLSAQEQRIEGDFHSSLSSIEKERWGVSSRMYKEIRKFYSLKRDLCDYEGAGSAAGGFPPPGAFGSAAGGFPTTTTAATARTAILQSHDHSMESEESESLDNDSNLDSSSVSNSISGSMGIVEKMNKNRQLFQPKGANIATTTAANSSMLRGQEVSKMSADASQKQHVNVSKSNGRLAKEERVDDDVDESADLNISQTSQASQHSSQYGSQSISGSAPSHSHRLKAAAIEDAADEVNIRQSIEYQDQDSDNDSDANGSSLSHHSQDLADAAAAKKEEQEKADRLKLEQEAEAEGKRLAQGWVTTLTEPMLQEAEVEAEEEDLMGDSWISKSSYDSYSKYAAEGSNSSSPAAGSASNSTGKKTKDFLKLTPEEAEALKQQQQILKQQQKKTVSSPSGSDPGSDSDINISSNSSHSSDDDDHDDSSSGVLESSQRLETDSLNYSPGAKKSTATSGSKTKSKKAAMTPVDIIRQQLIQTEAAIAVQKIARGRLARKQVEKLQRELRCATADAEIKSELEQNKSADSVDDYSFASDADSSPKLYHTKLSKPGLGGLTSEVTDTYAIEEAMLEDSFASHSSGSSRASTGDIHSVSSGGGGGSGTATPTRTHGHTDSSTDRHLQEDLQLTEQLGAAVEALKSASDARVALALAEEEGEKQEEEGDDALTADASAFSSAAASPVSKQIQQVVATATDASAGSPTAAGSSPSVTTSAVPSPTPAAPSPAVAVASSASDRQPSPSFELLIDANTSADAEIEVEDEIEEEDEDSLVDEADEADSPNKTFTTINSPQSKSSPKPGLSSNVTATSAIEEEEEDEEEEDYSFGEDEFDVDVDVDAEAAKKNTVNVNASNSDIEESMEEILEEDISEENGGVDQSDEEQEQEPQDNNAADAVVTVAASPAADDLATATVADPYAYLADASIAELRQMVSDLDLKGTITTAGSGRTKDAIASDLKDYLIANKSNADSNSPSHSKIHSHTSTGSPGRDSAGAGAEEESIIDESIVEESIVSAADADSDDVVKRADAGGANADVKPDEYSAAIANDITTADATVMSEPSSEQYSDEYSEEEEEEQPAAAAVPVATTATAVVADAVDSGDANDMYEEDEESIVSEMLEAADDDDDGSNNSDGDDHDQHELYQSTVDHLELGKSGIVFDVHSSVQGDTQRADGAEAEVEAEVTADAIDSTTTTTTIASGSVPSSTVKTTAGTDSLLNELLDSDSDSDVDTTPAPVSTMVTTTIGDINDSVLEEIPEVDDQEIGRGDRDIDSDEDDDDLYDSLLAKSSIAVAVPEIAAAVLASPAMSPADPSVSATASVNASVNMDSGTATTTTPTVTAVPMTNKLRSSSDCLSVASDSMSLDISMVEEDDIEDGSSVSGKSDGKRSRTGSVNESSEDTVEMVTKNTPIYQIASNFDSEEVEPAVLMISPSAVETGAFFPVSTTPTGATSDNMDKSAAMEDMEDDNADAKDSSISRISSSTSPSNDDDLHQKAAKVTELVMKRLLQSVSNEAQQQLAASAATTTTTTTYTSAVDTPVADVMMQTLTTATEATGVGTAIATVTLTDSSGATTLTTFTGSDEAEVEAGTITAAEKEIEVNEELEELDTDISVCSDASTPDVTPARISAPTTITTVLDDEEDYFDSPILAAHDHRRHRNFYDDDKSNHNNKNSDSSSDSSSSNGSSAEGENNESDGYGDDFEFTVEEVDEEDEKISMSKGSMGSKHVRSSGVGDNNDDWREGKGKEEFAVPATVPLPTSSSSSLTSLSAMPSLFGAPKLKTDTQNNRDENNYKDSDNSIDYGYDDDAFESDGESGGSNSLIKKSFSQAMDDLYEFDEFESVSTATIDSGDTSTKSAVEEQLKGHEKQKRIPMLARPITPPPLEYVNWSVWISTYVDELFTLRRDDMEYVLEQLKKPTTTSFMWDDVYVGVETTRSKYYKNQSNLLSSSPIPPDDSASASASASASGSNSGLGSRTVSMSSISTSVGGNPNDNNTTTTINTAAQQAQASAQPDYLPELPLSQDLSIHQKHNKAIFDRINTILMDFHRRRHANAHRKVVLQQSQSQSSKSRLNGSMFGGSGSGNGRTGIGSSWNTDMAAELYPITLSSMQSYIKRKLLEEEQCSLDVLVGKKAYTDIVECTVLDEIIEESHAAVAAAAAVAATATATSSRNNTNPDGDHCVIDSKADPQQQRLHRQAEMVTDYLLGRLLIDVSRDIQQSAGGH